MRSLLQTDLHGSRVPARRIPTRRYEVDLGRSVDGTNLQLIH
jgi:hypothetical protein